MTTTENELPRVEPSPPDEPPAEQAASGTADRTSWLRRYRPDGALLAFCLLAATVGTFFAVITPPMFGPDEASHVTRVWSISEGVVVSDSVTDLTGAVAGETIPASLDAVARWAYLVINDHPSTPFPQIAEPDRLATLESAPLDSPTVPTLGIFSTARTYTPVAYVPFLPGMAIAKVADLSVGATIVVLRLLGLAAYTVLVGTAIRVLAHHRARFLVLVAALIPMSLFQAATVTADTMTLGLSILVGALILKSLFLRQTLSPAEGIALFVAAALIPLSKAGYIVFLPAVLLVPAALLPRGRLAKTAGGLVVAGGAATFVWWNQRTTSAMVFQRLGLDRIAPADQVAFVAEHPITFVRIVVNTFSSKGTMYFGQFFGDLGFTFVSIPALATVAVILAAVVAFGNAERVRAPLGSTFAVLLVVLAGVASIFAALYLNYSPVGYYFIDGVQGRYFLPLVLLVLGVLLRLVPLRWHLPEPRNVRACEVSIVCLVATALVLAALKYYFVVWV